MVLDEYSLQLILENSLCSLDDKMLILCTLTKKLVLQTFSLKLYQNQSQSTWCVTNCRIRP